MPSTQIRSATVAEGWDISRANVQLRAAPLVQHISGPASRATGDKRRVRTTARRNGTAVDVPVPVTVMAQPQRAGKERGGFMAPKYPPRENKGNNGKGGRRINAIDDPEARARAYYGGEWADGGEIEKGERMENSDDEARYDFEEKGDGGEQKGGGMAGKARQ